MTLTNGAIYDGLWKDGNENGEGTLTLSNGIKKKGIFKDGRF